MYTVKMTQHQMEEVAALQFPKAFFREVYFANGEWHLNAKFNFKDGDGQYQISCRAIEFWDGIYFEEYHAEYL